MYEDRRESFTIKDVILQLLFIVLLVFILIWLFPTKGYLEKRLDGVNDSLKPLYTRLFTDNILTMKEAARTYYTVPRLPQKVGDKVKMTLGEMYEKGLLLELVDSNNKACDITKSYVELTKKEEEFELKTVLSCSDKEAFVIELLGCYDYCQGGLCSKPSSTVTPVEKYRYQYVLRTGGTCGDFGSWSEWTANKIDASDNVKVDTKTERVLDHYEQVYAVVDTKYVDEKYTENVSFGYSTKTIKRTTTYGYTTKQTSIVMPYTTKKAEETATVPYAEKTVKKTALYDYTTKTTTTLVPYATTVSTKDTIVGYSVNEVKVTTTYGYSYKNVPVSSEWVTTGRIEVKGEKTSTDTIKYLPVSTREEVDCENACKTVIYTTYDVQEKKVTYERQKYCAIGKDNGSVCVHERTEKQNFCPSGEDTGSGCKISANQTVLYCTQGVDNGSGCAVSTTEKYCAQGTDTGSGCQVETYEKQKYCAQGTDNGSSCTISGEGTVKYCAEGTDVGKGCLVTKVSTYCAQGTDTGSNCQVVEYVKQNYCSMGTDTGSGCNADIEKTRKVAQLIYDYKDGDPVYKNVTYYRSKTRSCSGGSVDYKWSESDNDKSLKDKGYTLTGVKELIK